MRQHGIVIGGIATNLSMPITIKDFLDNPIENIVVNLGGTTKEIHEKNMLHSKFDLVVNNLRELWAAGIPVKVKINPTKTNISQLSDLPRFCESLGGKAEYSTSYTTWFPHPEDSTEEERQYFIDNVYAPEHAQLFRFSFQDGQLKQSEGSCPEGLMVDTIFADGGLAICCHDHHEQAVVGNVFTNSLEEIRTSSDYRQMYWNGLRRKLPCCKYCA